MKALVSLDQTPPSANTNTGVGGRGNPKGIARTKKQWEQIFGGLLMEAKVPRNLHFLRVTPFLMFRTPNRRDVDNFFFPISKPLGDVLVSGGWIPDDTPEHFECKRPTIIAGVKDLGAKSRLTLEFEWEPPASSSPTPP